MEERGQRMAFCPKTKPHGEERKSRVWQWESMARDRTGTTFCTFLIGETFDLNTVFFSQNMNLL
jgi:hypothetical protein